MNQKVTNISKTHHSHLDNNWYSKNTKILKNNLATYFNNARANFPVPDNGKIKALIVPHAGYYYSGICAATAYQTFLQKNRTQKNTAIKRVIILAPSHTRAYNGIALPDYSSYQTPLGNIMVDETAISSLENNPVFINLPAAHATEHSLEVQLPFLQSTLESFTIVPLIVGTLTSTNLLSAAQSLLSISDDSTIIIVSSDFIHHGPSFNYSPFNHQILNHIKMVDSLAIQAISQQSCTDLEKILEQTGATICGREPIRLLLTLMQLNNPKNIHTSLACYYTSVHAQAAHAQNSSFNATTLLQKIPDEQAQQSVSYAALIMTEQQSNIVHLDTLLTEYEKKELLTQARKTLENYFAPNNLKLPNPLLYPIASSALCTPYGAFVTLNSSTGQLRGCIGRITTTEPLYRTILDISLDAALHDTRFTPLASSELPNTIIDISILTQPRPIASIHEIILGKHGIILNKRNAHGKITNSAVFLARVATELGWDITTTLKQLSLKAGLPEDAWKYNVDFEVFEEIVLKEKT